MRCVLPGKTTKLYGSPYLAVRATSCILCTWSARATGRLGVAVWWTMMHLGAPGENPPLGFVHGQSLRTSHTSIRSGVPSAMVRSSTPHLPASLRTRQPYTDAPVGCAQQAPAAVAQRQPPAHQRQQMVRQALPQAPRDQGPVVVAPRPAYGRLAWAPRNQTLPGVGCVHSLATSLVLKPQLQQQWREGYRPPRLHGVGGGAQLGYCKG